MADFGGFQASSRSQIPMVPPVSKRCWKHPRKQRRIARKRATASLQPTSR